MEKYLTQLNAILVAAQDELFPDEYQLLLEEMEDAIAEQQYGGDCEIELLPEPPAQS